MNITKTCVLLSNKNIELMTNIRERCNTNCIHLFLCKSINEAIDFFNQGTNSVLVEYVDEFKNLKSYISENNNSNFFYIKENKIYDINLVLKYDNIDDFLNSDIFCKNVLNDASANVLVDTKLKSLNVVFNNWQNRCIKFILSQLIKLNNINKLETIVKDVALLNNISVKLLYEELRPSLIETTKTLIKDQSKNLYTKDMIVLLYDYCLKTV